VALINTGLGRSRSAAQALLGNLALIAVTVIVFAFIGASLRGRWDRKTSFCMWLESPGACSALARFFSAVLAPLRRRPSLRSCLSFWPSAMMVLLPWGSGAIVGGSQPVAQPQRFWRRLFFPLTAHWIWAGGLLESMGANFSLGAGFVDGGGAATVHVIGGLTALCVVWIAGPRRGKFPKEGLSHRHARHDATYVLFGCLLALVGWLAWNAAGAILWLHAPLSAISGHGDQHASLCFRRARCNFFRHANPLCKPDASLCANGWLAGLLPQAACAAFAYPVEALFVGAVAGIFTPLLVEVLELALSIDDPPAPSPSMVWRGCGD